MKCRVWGISRLQNASLLPKLFLLTKSDTSEFPMTLAKWFFDNSRTREYSHRARRLGRRGSVDGVGETSHWNPTGESPVRSKLASGPVASVAIHRATGGCEAYTARKQAVKIQLRNLLMIAMPTPLRMRKAALGHDRNCEGRAEIAGVSSSGHVSKGIPQEPRRARHLRQQKRKRGRQGRP
jgi:hypothetical protein